MTKNIDEINQKLENASAEEIVTWAVKTYSSKVGLTSSFGTQSSVLLNLATQADPKIPVYFIDTGFLFKETHQYARDLTKLLNLNLITISPDPKDVETVKKRLKENAPECCDDIKVKGMKKVINELDCWIAGLRRDQAKTRKDVKIIEEVGEGLIKVHPIAKWSSKDVYEYMKKHNLPHHPLWEKGYTSIGCEPCTRPPTAGGDERSGRWVDQDKTECGIHTFLDKK